jgi:outer membrane protein assembly factor BamB
VGTLIHPRPQTSTENCTWHNYNVVPSDRRYLLVSGNYQSGVSVVDFTDPVSPREIAFADPAPLSDTSLVAGGDWSSYWYDGRIYESDMRRGLIIWRLSGSAAAGAKKLRHLNPQTQETSFPLSDGG